MTPPDNVRRPSEPSLFAVLVRKPALAVWFLFLWSIPFYFGPSGLPQPGNVLLLPLLPLAVGGWNGRFEVRALRFLRALILFVGWVWIINYGWGLVTERLSLSTFGHVPLYYTFNTIMVFIALVLARRHGENFFRVTFYATLTVSLFLVAASRVYRGEGGIRASLFFNNPNQLGYWSLLAATTIVVCHRNVRLGIVRTLAGLLASVYLAVLSGSRAAVGGILILSLLLVVSSPRVLIVAAVASLALLVLGGDPADALDPQGLRALQRGSRGTSFSDERAYSRIWEFKEYVLIGAGESANDRFVHEGQHEREIHSTVGTVIFSYGVIGFVLFTQLCLRLIRGLNVRTAILLLPVMMYSVAHQGLRFSMFWIVIALFAGLRPETAPRPLQA